MKDGIGVVGVSLRSGDSRIQEQAVGKCLVNRGSRARLAARRAVVKAKIADIKGASVQFWPAAKVGDRVCLSWHGSKPGIVVEADQDLALVEIGSGSFMSVALADCCVAHD